MKNFSIKVRDQLLVDLLNARMQHMRWVNEVMNNKFSLAEPSHTDCQFGKWMLKVSESLEHLSEFQNLELPHRLLHQSYQTLQNAPEQEQHKLDVKSYSSQLIDAIDALEQRINHLG